MFNRSTFDLDSAIRAFDALNVSDRIEFGFNHKGKLYKLIATSAEEVRRALKIVNDSENGLPALRFRPKELLRAAWIANGRAIKIADQPLKLYDNTPNMGWAFERFCYERLGRKWKGMDSLPMWEGGDITVAGHPIQLKFTDSTLISLKTLNRAIEEGRL